MERTSPALPAFSTYMWSNRRCIRRSVAAMKSKSEGRVGGVRTVVLSVSCSMIIICGISALVSSSWEFPALFLVTGSWFDNSAELESEARRADRASNYWESIDMEEAQGNSLDWRKRSKDWWGNRELKSKLNDSNWNGRHKMHNALKDGKLWFDEEFENYFISELEAHQFPSNCMKNFWIAIRAHEAGLLSATHVFSPVLFMAMVKGNGYTALPVQQIIGDPEIQLPTFDGCGERKDKHIGCFFNITSCRIDEDPARLASVDDETRANVVGANWDSLMEDQTTGPGGMTILRSFLYRGDAPSFDDAWTRPKLKLWKKFLEHGSTGVHNRPRKDIAKLQNSEVDFVLHSMISAWMMQKTSAQVKKIADNIMAKYADADGRPLWVPPVLALHVRMTDKTIEDPYFRTHGKYRSVEEYVEKMEELERKYSFRWESIFIISDSGTAIHSLAQLINNVTGAPDSRNGEEGKRFIMYDYSYDDNLIERQGGHTHVPPEVKYSAQEHFLATLYIMSNICDYAIVQFSSNVGRFLTELIGARHRLSCPDPVGPNSYSVDTGWTHS